MQGVTVNDVQPDTRGVKRKRKKGHIDYNLLVVVCILMAFGLVMVYSSSYFTASISRAAGYDPAFYLKHQAIFSIVGLGVAIFVSFIDYHFWYNKSWFLYIFVIALMVWTLIAGNEINGAKRWITLFGITFQPSEIAKVAIILSLAKLLKMNYKRLNQFPKLLVICAYVAVPVALAGIENLSSAVIMAGIIGVMLFFALPKLRHVFYLGAMAGVALFIIYQAKDYRQNRFDEWANGGDGLTGAVTQSSAAINAIGSGGLFGKGIGQSLQKMGTLSEAHNDMIFSIICEEFGFIGGVGVILLFVVLVYRMFRIVVNSYDLYGALIVVGVMTHIGLQALVNVAVVTGVIPNTGVTLPFISYGGTSLLFLFGEIGLVLSVAKSMFKEG